MRSRARLLGHAVHPMLIVFPLGLLSTAVVFDIIFLISDRAGFATAAAYAIAAGVLGGAVAAVPGLIDWTAIPAGTRARRIATFHGLANGVVVAIFTVSWALRVGAPAWEPSALAVILGFVGVAIAGVSGWLGGELVERLGVGVDEGAHIDAPNSLSHPGGV